MPQLDISIMPMQIIESVIFLKSVEEFTCWSEEIII